MSVCSSGMQQQRRKKLENKQKFVFDEKDVVPPLRAAVKKTSVQVTDTYVGFLVEIFFRVKLPFIKKTGKLCAGY